MTVPQSMVRFIEEAIRDSDASVELAIFETSDPNSIAQAVDKFCRAQLNVPVQRCLFYVSSQGAVFGVLLKDGRRVVVKAHQPDRSVAFLSEVHAVQRLLRSERFPCPAPVLRPSPLGAGLAVVDEFLDDGDFADAHAPAIRTEMARALAWLVGLAAPLASSGNLPRRLRLDPSPRTLWTRPHHRMFDFDATSRGAEWIDAIAAAALEVLSSGAGDVVVGHTDWSVKDFRFRGPDITAIYDWDSLAIEREPVIVGRAATHFTMTWRLPVRIAPTNSEVSAFVASYEESRGEKFSAAEREAIEAAGQYSMAYTARCEHALDPQAREFPAGSAREFLATASSRFTP